MRYRAVAVGGEDSNTVGALEIECTPDGLFVAYQGAGAFKAGYAPAALTSGTAITVPWSELSEARVEGEHVIIAFSSRLTPLNRLRLTQFKSGRALPKEELARRRLVVRAAASSAALMASLLIGARLLSSPELGTFFALFSAGLAGALLLGAGFIVDKHLAEDLDDAGSHAAFSIELGRYVPNLLRSERPPDPPLKLPDIAALQGFLPRTTIAIVIAISASALGLLLVARSVMRDEAKKTRLSGEARSAPPNGRLADTPGPFPSGSRAAAGRLAESKPGAAPGERVDAAGDKALKGGAPLGADCVCERADSVLWSEPIPRVSVLVLSHRVRLGRGEKERPNRRYTELELGLVNNTRDPISQVALLVSFFERRRSEKSGLAYVDARPLFFPGPLAPGQAIRWKITARGTEFEVPNPSRGALAPDGRDAASPSAFAALLETNKYRSVRLHAAMMLAFLGDARYREGALALRDALREDEAPYLNRLLASQAALRVCQLHVTGDGPSRTASACLYNASREPQKELGVTLRGLDGRLSAISPVAEPPTVLVENAFPIAGVLQPRTGRMLRLSLDVGDTHPQVYEGYASELQ